MTRDPKGHGSGRLLATAGLGLLVALAGCKLDEVQIPGLSGPSELAFSLNLTASPDVLVADGFSTASIQAQARGPNGEALSGRAIFFAIQSGGGLDADIGTLSSTTAVTNGSGIAQVIYTVPHRTDFTANGTVLVTARPVGDDANGAIYRRVRIELRSAEPHFFPQNPDNTAPNCAFNVEPGTGGFFPGNQILFKDTSSDPDPGDRIVRYEWDFGDGTKEDKPDVNHAYAFSGTYTVTHVVTDSFGAQGVCPALLVTIQ